MMLPLACVVIIYLNQITSNHAASSMSYSHVSICPGIDHIYYFDNRNNFSYLSKIGFLLVLLESSFIFTFLVHHWVEGH